MMPCMKYVDIIGRADALNHTFGKNKKGEANYKYIKETRYGLTSSVYKRMMGGRYKKGADSHILEHFKLFVGSLVSD